MRVTRNWRSVSRGRCHDGWAMADKGSAIDRRSFPTFKPARGGYRASIHCRSDAIPVAEPKAFNVSMFVEEAKSNDASNESCFKYYWPLAKRNPLVDKQSIKTETLPKFVKVTYLVRAHDSTAFDVNYYFAFHGCWVDLHASWFPAATDADQKLAAFEQSIVVELTKDKAQAK